MKRIKAPIERLRDEDYRQLWRVVDGAITDCVIHHPEYFRDTGMVAVRQSIIKRVVGALLGYAKQRGRSGTTGGRARGCERLEGGAVCSCPSFLLR